MTSISQIQQDQPPQVMEKLKEIKELSLSEIDKKLQVGKRHQISDVFMTCQYTKHLRTSLFSDMLWLAILGVDI